jgi:hypothetical protein
LRNFGLLVIAVTAVLSLATQASAQRIFGMMSRQFMLLNPKVQAELNLTEAQKQAIKRAAGDAVSTDDQGRTRIQLTSGMNLDSMKQDLRKAITSEQDKRLIEIWIQKDGALTLSDAEVAKSVGLSSDQKKKVEAIIDGMGEDIRELAMSNGGQVNHNQAKGVKDKAQKSLEGVLTTDQKKKFEAMKGKPFKI